MKKTVAYFLWPILLGSYCSCSGPTVVDLDQPWWSPVDRQLIIDELQRTTAELRQEVDPLTQDQYRFREAPDRWSISEIVEHLEIQNQLHFREISIAANAPQYLQYRHITEGQDDYFSQYAVDTTRGQARWFLEPLGRFPEKEDGLSAFMRARGHLTEFVEQTEIDLRKQFTFRTPVEGKELSELRIGQVRDLHQLLLTGIAHTERHLRQIRQIKRHADFPALE